MMGGSWRSRGFARRAFHSLDAGRDVQVAIRRRLGGQNPASVPRNDSGVNLSAGVSAGRHSGEWHRRNAVRPKGRGGRGPPVGCRPREHGQQGVSESRAAPSPRGPAALGGQQCSGQRCTGRVVQPAQQRAGGTWPRPAGALHTRRQQRRRQAGQDRRSRSRLPARYWYGVELGHVVAGGVVRTAWIRKPRKLSFWSREATTGAEEAQQPAAAGPSLSGMAISTAAHR